MKVISTRGRRIPKAHHRLSLGCMRMGLRPWYSAGRGRKHTLEEPTHPLNANGEEMRGFRQGRRGTE